MDKKSKKEGVVLSTNTCKVHVEWCDTGSTEAVKTSIFLEGAFRPSAASDVQGEEPGAKVKKRKLRRQGPRSPKKTRRSTALPAPDANGNGAHVFGWATQRVILSRKRCDFAERDLANGLAIFVAAELQGVCALPGDASNTDIYTQAGNRHVFLSDLQATPDYEDVAALLK